MQYPSVLSFRAVFDNSSALLRRMVAWFPLPQIIVIKNYLFMASAWCQVLCKMLCGHILRGSKARGSAKPGRRAGEFCNLRALAQVWLLSIGAVAATDHRRGGEDASQ